MKTRSIQIITIMIPFADPSSIVRRSTMERLFGNCHKIALKSGLNEEADLETRLVHPDGNIGAIVHCGYFKPGATANLSVQSNLALITVTLHGSKELKYERLFVMREAKEVTVFLEHFNSLPMTAIKPSPYASRIPRNLKVCQ